MGYDALRKEEYNDLVHQLLRTPSVYRGGGEFFVRVQYVRYADDFIIGVEGSYTLAKKILVEISDFVEGALSLCFNPDKTGIIDYSKKSVSFLGYTLMAAEKAGINKGIEQIKVKDRVISRRKKIRVRVNMDYLKVLNKLLSKGIIRKRVNHSDHKALVYRGTFQGNLINLDHADIIRYYNSVIRGIYYYYDFVGNRGKLLWIT
jgi:hypothetical protein